MTPVGQRWTRSKPTEPGWYWYRTLLGDREVVKIGRVGHALMVYGHGYGAGSKLEYQSPGEWQGPIFPSES